MCLITKHNTIYNIYLISISFDTDQHSYYLLSWKAQLVNYHSNFGEVHRTIGLFVTCHQHKSKRFVKHLRCESEKNN